MPADADQYSESKAPLGQPPTHTETQQSTRCIRNEALQTKTKYDSPVTQETPAGKAPTTSTGRNRRHHIVGWLVGAAIP